MKEEGWGGLEKRSFYDFTSHYHQTLVIARRGKKEGGLKRIIVITAAARLRDVSDVKCNGLRWSQ